MTLTCTFFRRFLERQPPPYLPTLVREGQGFRNHYPLHPARNIVGEPASPLPPDDPLRTSTSQPMHAQRYRGRLEEPDGEDGVLARLWEQPSGRETLVVLSLHEHIKQQKWRQGSVVDVWTWIEYGPHGERYDRVWVRVRPTLPGVVKEGMGR